MLDLLLNLQCEHGLVRPFISAPHDGRFGSFIVAKDPVPRKCSPMAGRLVLAGAVHRVLDGPPCGLSTWLCRLLAAW